jgi:hypothetical protein
MGLAGRTRRNQVSVPIFGDNMYGGGGSGGHLADMEYQVLTRRFMRLSSAEIYSLVALGT